MSVSSDLTKLSCSRPSNDINLRGAKIRIVIPQSQPYFLRLRQPLLDRMPDGGLHFGYRMHEVVEYMPGDYEKAQCRSCRNRC
jgi:hypothetical protein